MTIPASMPISATYLGDGVTVNYPVPFMYFENADGTKQISVVVADDTGENEQTLVENTDFTITAAGEPNGTLTLVQPLAANKKISIVYDIPIEQEKDMKEFARLPSEAIEAAFDKVTAILKQHKEIIERCVKVTISNNQTPQELLDDVYLKLDSATAIAADAIAAANEAETAADAATAAVESAEATLSEVTSYVDTSKADIATTVADAKADVDNTVTEAENSIETTISNAIAEVKEQAVAAAEETIADASVTVTNTAKANLDEYVDGTVEPSLQSYVDAAAAAAADAATTLEEVEAVQAGFTTVYNNRVSEFNANASTKTSDFNTNAANKQADIDNAADQVALLANDAGTSASAASASETAAASSATAAKQSELLAAALAERVRSEGIPMSVIEQRRIEKSGNTAKMWWQDPRDTVIDGFVLSSWKSTTIVKKQGSYPTDVDDGVVVEIITQRDKYLNNPLTDTQENADDWYYRAFPLSVNGVYNLDNRNCFGTVIFGYRIDETDPVPDTRVEYLPFTDNVFYDPCRMDFVSDVFNWGDWRNAFFIPKPCALLYSGAVDYYLNPDDFTKKADGSASDVANTGYGGNFMVEFPAIFAKVYKHNNHINVLISNQKVDDGFECWACKKSDGTYAPNFYLPMFEGTSVSSVLRSVATTGKPTASLNAETEATQATANGSGWNTTTWADEMLMMLLFPLLFKTTDSQTALGYGGTASSSALTVNNNAAVSKGLMYGTSGASAYGITYLGMHNWWGHRWRRPNGLMNDNGNIKVKLTHSTIDGSTVTGYNRTGNGYISTGYRPPEASASYINRYEPLGGGAFGIVPKATSGSSSTFYCDGMWTNNGQLDQLILGGAVHNGAIAGVFCFNVSDLPSNAYWTHGASISYHHL